MQTLGIVETNLVVSLDAGDPASYPGSGSTWTNLVDSTNYTIVSGSYSSGSGGSIVFNGASTYVSLGTVLSNGSNFTKEAWVSADVLTAGRNIISSVDNVFFTNTTTLYGGVGAQYLLVGSPNFPTGVWRHVALTFDDAANTLTLYINGTQVAQNASVTQSYITGTERIGAHYSGGAPVSFWDGNIAVVRVYDEALTAAQVSQNYDAQRSRFGL